MGDRSNIVVQEHNGNRIWLYGHWMGSDSINVTRDVLNKQDRWNDSQYFARMLFSEMVKGSLDETTGYGISTYMCDNEYPIIVLDFGSQTAWLEDTDWNDLNRNIKTLTEPIPFKQFLNALNFCEGSFESLANNINARQLV
jgi:hypothetical protein